MHKLIGRISIGLLVIVATTAIACGGDDDDSSPAPAAATTQAPTATQAAAAAGSVEVTVTEWSLKPTQSSIAAGEVTFDVANGGAVPHEFVVIRTGADPTALPLAAGAADESSLDVVGRSDMIQGGISEQVTFTLTAGSYVLICNIPAHYGLGMSAAFTVN
jgi:uncharacterized cupredoxin-like copper-binding protein